MSSKTGAEPRPWSLALRLALWYAASAFALVLLATGYLYWALVGQLVEEDDEWLAGKVAEVRRATETRTGDTDLRHLVEAGGGRAAERILVRVDDSRGPTPLVIETPGLSTALPLTVFPESSGAVGSYRSPDGRVYRLRTERDATGAVVIRAAIDRTEDEELLEGHRRRLAYVLVVSLVVCTLGGYRLARSGLRPIEAVRDTARRIGPTALAERIDTRGLPAEVRTLADTFNEMLARLEGAFTRLSRFSADIAHELRTPVNNLRGEIEVALGKPRTLDEYREVLGSCLEECGRLARLIDSLLFLARSEDRSTSLQTEPVDVAAELAAVREFFEPMAAEAGVTLVTDAAPGLSAPADRTLFQRAVANLVSNSLAHTPAGGTVTLAAAREDDSVRVTVRDTGSGIASEDLPHVFDRFYRADKARTSSSAGRVGLGLAIVKGIVEWHGGTASATSTPGEGTMVCLRFPAGGKMTKM
jgi:two-component system heavy metal sensor histidine kinase CusS